MPPVPESMPPRPSALAVLSRVMPSLQVSTRMPRRTVECCHAQHALAVETAAVAGVQQVLCLRVRARGCDDSQQRLLMMRAGDSAKQSALFARLFRTASTFC